MIKLLQKVGQRIFMRTENLLNGVFGATLNPFYYLGAITYLMFWIIVVSGFYIYIFYDTGVNDAFASVERITHEQWYLGGIMRSLHRYASDAMILAGVLHMVRNFVFDRYRNFRWFSWFTGVALLWLVYIAGINGYWLVWDSLAQFLAVASAEWLDWLPIFSAPLARNFLESGSVNDRFFSLLSLIHIGVPLAIFGLIWIHTQRVPQAKTSPPKPLTIGLILCLIVLSLIYPALSQGRSDLDATALTLKFDWFYLWTFPLLYSWGGGKVWALSGGFTALALLLPFLGWSKRGKGEYQINTIPCGHSLTSKDGETVLEAALREGISLPYVCRDGACGECKGRILKGAVDYGTYQEGVLTEAEKAQGKALFCCAKPLTDIDIECHEVDQGRRFSIKVLSFSVNKMVRAAPDVMLLDLMPEGNQRMDFMAGQYVAVLLEDGSKRSYSIANPPHDSEHLQLHIRRVEGGKFTSRVFNEMKVGEVLQIEGPYGNFHLHEDSQKPIILMSGGCGFGSLKGIVEYAFNVGITRPITLYWGARTPEDIYSDLPERWQQAHENFTFIPVLSEPKPEHGWSGRVGLVHEAVLQDHTRLDDYQVYACGSPGMVEASRAPFFAQGLPEDQYFSDAFFVACYPSDAVKATLDSVEVKHE
jgi:NAD(P)H-flavin reductase/quinol-cytochrome oxidoreductase complex cytochrome b subunit